jgi:hypothetical protein
LRVFKAGSKPGDADQVDGDNRQVHCTHGSEDDSMHNSAFQTGELETERGNNSALRGI